MLIGEALLSTVLHSQNCVNTTGQTVLIPAGSTAAWIAALLYVLYIFFFFLIL